MHQNKNASTNLRNDTLTYKTKKTNKRHPLIVTFKATLPQFSIIPNSNWNLLQPKAGIKNALHNNL